MSEAGVPNIEVGRVVLRKRCVSEFGGMPGSFPTDFGLKREERWGKREGDEW